MGEKGVIMERLTFKTDKIFEPTGLKYAPKNHDRYFEILNKLGEYEDLEEQGLLLREEDVLKFYYCESKDKYLVGKRLDTLYYAEIGKTGLCFEMSRYLPWGKHVVDANSAWKEYTYPSEPKEIPFFEWLQGYMKQQTLAEMEKEK